MIQFPCHGCGQVFSVADDDAGRSIQCRSCGRLTDVPTHSELSSLSEDGTFRLIEAPPAAGDPADRLAEVARAFRKARLDEQGEEIDLRSPPEEPLALSPGQRERYKPQYDPETGDLVRPLDLRTDDRDMDPASIPMAAPAPLDQAGIINYAPVGEPELRTHTPFVRLLEPVNLAVMWFVLVGLLLGYVLQLLISFITAHTYPIPVWPLNIMFWLTASHFGNTIVAIGPDEHDELPRPLLSLGLWDDILSPLSKVLGAILICYLPMFAVLALASGRARAIALPLMIIGGFYFPAVLLTLTTSGSIWNLRPDRIRRVIGIGGTRYLMLAAGWVIAFPAFVWASLGVNLLFDALGIEASASKSAQLLLAGLLGVVSVFFLHYFCWQLGLLYRVGHERFGWVWEELLRHREEDRKRRGALTAADRAIMRRQRKQRAAGGVSTSKIHSQEQPKLDP